MAENDNQQQGGNNQQRGNRAPGGGVTNNYGPTYNPPQAPHGSHHAGENRNDAYTMLALNAALGSRAAPNASGENRNDAFTMRVLEAALSPRAASDAAPATATSNRGWSTGQVVAFAIIAVIGLLIGRGIYDFATYNLRGYDGSGFRASVGGLPGSAPRVIKRSEFGADGQAYCAKYAPGTTFFGWEGSGIGRRANCG